MSRPGGGLVSRVGGILVMVKCLDGEFGWVNILSIISCLVTPPSFPVITNDIRLLSV